MAASVFYFKAVCPSARRAIDFNPLLENLRGQSFSLAKPVQVAGVNNFAAASARANSKLNDVISKRNNLRIVFDDEDVIIFIAELEKELANFLGVGGVKTGSRLVKNVGDVVKTACEVANNFKPLILAAGKSIRPPRHGQVANANFNHAFERCGNLFGKRNADRLVNRLKNFKQVGGGRVHVVDDIQTVDF